MPRFRQLFPAHLISWPRVARELAGMHLLSLIALLLIPFVIVISMVLLGYQSSAALAQRQAQTELERTADHTVSKLSELIQPVRSLVRVAAGLGGLTPEYFRREESHLLLDEMLAHSPTIDSVSVSMPDGAFRMSLRVDGDTWRTYLGAPDLTELGHRWLTQNPHPDAANDLFQFFDAGQRYLGANTRHNDFDPRRRAWYQEAVREGKPIVSEPYLFATKKAAGITVAMPFYDPKTRQLAGVVAANIMVSSITRFLSELPVSRNSQSMLLDARQRIIAYPDRPDRTPLSAHMESGGLVMQTLDSILPPSLISPGSLSDAAEGSEVDDRNYLLHTVALDNIVGKPWKLALVVPINDFLDPLNQRNRELLAVGLLSICLEALIVVLVLRRVFQLYAERQSAQAEVLVAKEEMLDTLKENEKRLESRVRERTLELEHLNNRLERLSTTDALTGIWNRRRFEEGLLQEWNRAARTESPVSLILLDVDWFKRYNDHYGHPAGDQCLKDIATTLQQTVCRAGDLFARIGGEEFAILVGGDAPDSAPVLAEKIRQAILTRALPHLQSPYRRITASIGIARLTPGLRTTTNLLFKLADDALYQAKARGRNRIALSVEHCTSTGWRYRPRQARALAAYRPAQPGRREMLN